jgi:hypothetical protein
MQHLRLALRNAWGRYSSLQLPSALASPSSKSRISPVVFAGLAAGFAAAGVALTNDGEMVVFSGNANPELAEVRIHLQL